MRIYLIGFMGSGKSFFGKKLAETLGFDFIDMDECIEQGEQKTITDIFKLEGETHFRYLEKKYLANTTSQINTIIATGGGTPCFFENIDTINQYGWSFYLEASPTLLASRLHSERSKRPLIATLDTFELQDFITKSLQKRAVFYEKAHVSIHQDELTTTNNINTIISNLSNWIKY